MRLKGFYCIALTSSPMILRYYNERSIFTGITMGIAMVVGLGITPVVLGVVADTWNFQIGIVILGVLTTLSCVFLRGLQEI